jgi:hypothetical protein
LDCKDSKSPLILKKIEKSHKKMEKCNLLNINNKADSKRQQTTAVDYKRLFNGFFLTDVVSLHYDVKRNRYGKENDKRQSTRGGCKLQPVRKGGRKLRPVRRTYHKL